MVCGQQIPHTTPRLPERYQEVATKRSSKNSGGDQGCTYFKKILPYSTDSYSIVPLGLQFRKHYDGTKPKSCP